MKPDLMELEISDKELVEITGIENVRAIYLPSEITKIIRPSLLRMIRAIEKVNV